jgi:hypothetical protein
MGDCLRFCATVRTFSVECVGGIAIVTEHAVLVVSWVLVEVLVERLRVGKVFFTALFTTSSVTMVYS